MGMAFVDTLLTETGATVVLVDENHQPGGHWNAVYPFVRLHQPSAYYGVNSCALGNEDAIDAAGSNEGFYELATGHQVCAYYDQVMRHQLLPTGRLSYFPSARYLGDNTFRTLGGAEHTVTVRRRVVDATYLLTVVQSMRPGRRSRSPTGSRWSPRTNCPGGRPTISTTRSSAAARPGWTAVSGCCATAFRPSGCAGSCRVTPGCSTAPTSSPGRNSSNSSNVGRHPDDGDRRGRLAGRPLHPAGGRPEPAAPRPDGVAVDVPLRDRVRSASWSSCASSTMWSGWATSPAWTPDRMVLAHGAIPVPAPSLYVDCTTPGLPRPPSVPVFDGDRITLQSVRGCQQVFSAAFIAHVEAAYGDTAETMGSATPFANRFHTPMRRSTGCGSCCRTIALRYGGCSNAELMDVAEVVSPQRAA